MDQKNYTYNGCGEFIFLDGNDGDFLIQVKFSQVIGAGRGTVISAVLIKEGNASTIQVNYDKDGRCQCLLS